MTKENVKRIKLDNLDDVILLDGYALVEAHDTEDRSKGGIVIPDTAQKSSWRGTVIKIGPGKVVGNIWPPQRVSPPLEVGDVVFYRNFQGWKVMEIDGTPYYAICGEEWLAKIPKAQVKYE